MEFGRILKVRLEAITTGYQAKLAAAQAQTLGFGQKMERTARRNSAAFTTMGAVGLGLGAAIGGGLLVAGKAALNFESSFAGVKKTVDATEGQFASMAAELRELAPELGVNVNELNAIAEEAGQLGIERESIVGFTETIAKLRETTDLVDAAPLARLMNIMQTSQGEVDRLGSAVVALGNDGASTESEIVDMAQGIAGAANIVGFHESDVLSFANALSSVGIEAQAGGSSLSRVMLDIGEAVDTGGDKLQGFADVAGMSVSDFQAAFEEDAARAIAVFIEGLGRMSESGGNVTGILRELGFSEIRTRRALLGLAGAGDLLTESLDLGTKAFRDNNAMNQEFEKRMETNRKKIDQAAAELNELAITIGSVLLPVIGAMAGAAAAGIGALTDIIGGLPGPLQAVGVGLAAITSAVLLLGGAALMLLPRVAATKVALIGLGVTAQTVGTTLSTLSKTAGLLGAGFIVLDQAMDLKNDIADEGFWTGLKRHMLGNIDTLSRWTGGFIGGGSAAREELDKMDAATGRVAGSSADAFGAIARLGDQAAQMAINYEKPTDSAGALNEALREQQNLQNQLAGGFLGLVGSMNEVRDSQEALADAQRKVNRLQENGRQGTPKYKNALDDLRDAQFGAVSAHVNATSSIRDYAKELKDSGAPQSRVNDQIREYGRRAGLTKGEVNKLIKEVNDYRGELGKIPPAKDTKVTANTDPARNAVDALLDKYRGMHVAVIVEGRVQGTGTVRHSGGWIPGSGEVPITAMAGEYIVRKDRSSKYADILQAINDGPEENIWERLAGKMHSGGLVEPRIILELGQLNSALKRAATAPSFGGGNLVDLGQWFLSLGARVSGHGAFGGTPTSGHAPNSLHYQNRAIDVNYGPGGASATERAFIAKYLPTVSRLGPTENLHPFNDPIFHDDHWHIGFRNGAYFNKDWTGQATMHKGEMVAPEPVMRQIVRQESRRSGGTLHIRGTLDTPFGPSEVRGIVVEQIEDDKRYVDSRERVSR